MKYPFCEGEVIVELLSVPRQGGSWLISQYQESQLGQLYSQLSVLNAVVKSSTSPKTLLPLIDVYKSCIETIGEDLCNTIVKDCECRTHFSQFLTLEQRKIERDIPSCVTKYLLKERNSSHA